MSPKKRTFSRRNVKQLRRQTALHDFLYGPNSKALIAAAAVLGAILYLNGALFRPMYESGPLPVPSRAELDALRNDYSMTTDGLRKSIDETLETAKAANQAAQQAVRTAADARLTRLLALRGELEAKLRATPEDKILNQVLADTNINIANLTGAPVAPQVVPASVAK